MPLSAMNCIELSKASDSLHLFQSQVQNANHSEATQNKSQLLLFDIRYCLAMGIGNLAIELRVICKHNKQ